MFKPLRWWNGVTRVGPHARYYLYLFLLKGRHVVWLYACKLAQVGCGAFQVCGFRQLCVGRDYEGCKHGCYGGVYARHKERHPHAAYAQQAIEQHVLDTHLVGSQHDQQERQSHGYVDNRNL